jgi:TctA family transporter
MILAFGQPEMAALVILGLSFLASLTGGSVTKGIISACLGLLISIIGHHSVTGVDRFSFGTTFLYDGINIVPLTLGLFGLAEIFSLVLKGQNTIVQKSTFTKLSGIFDGVKDVWRHKWLWFRSVILGHIIGIIPGIGAEAASWICYGQAKQTSKNPHEFGTGRIEGVIAPEAANNSGEAGGLLTTIALGIPGSTVMTFFLATFLIVGLSPGPKMVVEHLPLVLALFIAIALANISGGIIALFSVRHIAKIASVHIDYLVPSILIIAFAGTYAATTSLPNFVIILVFTCLGFFMKKYGYSRPALILGFVLGGMFENYVLLSLKLYGPGFFNRPISLILLSITVMILMYPLLSKVLTRYRKRMRTSKNER